MSGAFPGRVQILISRELITELLTQDHEFHGRISAGGVPPGAVLVSVGPAETMRFGRDLVQLVFEHESFTPGQIRTLTPIVTDLQRECEHCRGAS